MFEFLIAEWHITPDYIIRNWTTELLNLMLDKLVERKRRESAAIRGIKYISDSQLSDIPGVKWIKKQEQT